MDRNKLYVPLKLRFYRTKIKEKKLDGLINSEKYIKKMKGP